MKQTHSIGKLPQFCTLTREQGAAAVSPVKNAIVIAPAGSGKTKVAMAYAAARPNARGLYLAYGKPTQMEADRRLRDLKVATVAKTTHSLAWPSYGAALDRADKLQRGGGSLRTGVTAELLKMNWPLAKAVNETVKNYMCSPDKKLTDKHLPDDRDFPIVKFSSAAIMDGAQRYWTRLTDLNDQEAKAMPDVYLKQWVNADPKLDYDFIIGDEWQDANPLTALMISQQTHCSRIYIGDRHQSIYGFRGATDALTGLQTDKTHLLTASFRFGPKIATLASTFLKHWKGEQTAIRGLGVGGRIERNDQQAYLSRTVAGLIGKGFELHNKGQKLHWVKGFEDYRVAPILEAFRLYKGESSANFQDPVLKLMTSWTQLADYVEATGDGEAGPVFRLVEQYGDEIPNIIETLKREQLRDGASAPLVLTTAHRSKGLEYPVVRLINDFFSFKDSADTSKWLHPRRIDPQEANLMYVALTRAMKAVAPTTEMIEWFRQQADTHSMFPVPVQKEAAPAEHEAAPSPQVA